MRKNRHYVATINASEKEDGNASVEVVGEFDQVIRLFALLSETVAKQLNLPPKVLLAVTSKLVNEKLFVEAMMNSDVEVDMDELIRQINERRGRGEKNV